MMDGSQDRQDQASRPIVEQILDIVARETALDRGLLQPGARIDELGIASIDLVQSVFALESHFDIEIPLAASEGGAEFATVGDLVAHVLAAVTAAGKAPAAGTGG